MIPLFKVFMAPTVGDSVSTVLRSGYVGQGPVVEEFEQRLAEYLKWNHILTTITGTAGLHLALRLLNIGPGDSVISTAKTCTASNWPVLLAGADIQWADINPNTMNIDPEDVKQKITEKTKAIIAVHWGGYPCDIDRLKEVAGDIPIIEDCAHAFGSVYKGNPIGNSKNYCMFSFQAIKTFSTIEGGCLCVPEKEHERGKLLRWYGIDRDKKPDTRHELRCGLDIVEAGDKLNYNDVHATIGLEQLKYIDENLRIQRDNAAFYNRELANIPGLKLMQQETDRQSSYWLYTVKVQDREGFCRKMDEAGISVSQVHARNDLHSCVAKYKTDLPVLDIVDKEHISIPCGWWISEFTRSYIVEAIKKGW